MSESICSVKEFVEWTEKLEGQMLLYRGLADVDWDLESSANRRIRGEKHITAGTCNFSSKLYSAIVGYGKLAGVSEATGKGSLRPRTTSRIATLRGGNLSDRLHY